MLVVRLDSPVPLVDQLVAGLRLAIARGELRPGDGLPTVRQVAADLGINLNTVARAYRALEATGLVTTVRGRGTEVAAARQADARRGAKERAELARRLAETLADARLAGFERATVEELARAEIERIWKEE